MKTRTHSRLWSFHAAFYALGIHILFPLPVSLAHMGQAERPGSARCDGGTSALIASELESAMKAASRLNWWAASPEQIRGAACTRNSPLSDDELKAAMNQWASSEPRRESRAIHGISFEDENPKLLALFENLTTRRDIIGRPLANSEQHTFSSACKKVECALNQLFGEREALRLSYLSTQFGMNASHLVLSRDDPPPGRAINAARLDDIILSVSDFPRSLLPLRRSPFGSREDVQVRLSPDDEPGVLANARVTLFESWTRETPEERKTTLFHELGHRFGDFGDLDESDAWWNISGWRVPDGMTRETGWLQARPSHPEKCVSQYACQNPAEDFAESVVAYRYNPEGLIRVSPEKYAFLKATVFDGMEYRDLSTCSQPPRENLETRYETVRERAFREPAAVSAHADRLQASCDYWLSKCFTTTPRGTRYQLNPDAQSCLDREAGWAAGEFNVPASAEESRGLSPELAAAHHSFMTGVGGGSRIGGQTMPPAAQRAVETELQRRIRTDLRQALIQFDQGQGSLREGVRNRLRSVESYCQAWKAALTRATLPLPSLDHGHPGRSAITMGEQVTKIAERACLESQSSRWERHLLNPATLDRILDEVFGLRP